MDVRAVAVRLGRLGHERDGEAEIGCRLLHDDTCAHRPIARGDGVGRREVELELPGRALGTPRVPSDAHHIEPARHLVEEGVQLVGVLRQVPDRFREPERREVAVRLRARFGDVLGEHHPFDLERRAGRQSVGAESLDDALQRGP
jgi:hypothetical protein